MSVIGLDFGSHTASIAIWHEEKNSIEVLADDLGSRTIPCTVAFRGDEIITGQSAISQQHKNPSNTFDDVRSLLLNLDVSLINVPLLEKEIQAQELVSHFFRNIHNQIKQQAGKVIRDCIVSTPSELDEATKKRFTESAQAGGIRIKNFISDSAATLMAYELDDASHAPTKTLVVDVGWSRTDVALYDISAGMFNLLSSSSTNDVGGKVFVKLAADHCAKDFQRKTKVPCSEYSKSMIRLHRECENAMKSLSTGAEATIDIDSLCEGLDYSSKLTRARFEDLLTIPFIHLKKCINDVLASAGLDASSVSQVCMSGGPSAMPKVVSIIKGLFASAAFPKVKFESSETQCIGAATHGKYLLQQGLIDNAPTVSPIVATLTKSIFLASSVGDGAHSEVLPVNTMLPITVNLPATVSSDAGFLRVLVGGEVPAVDAKTVLGEIVFSVDRSVVSEVDNSLVVVTVAVSVDGAIKVDVTQSSSQVVIGTIVIPVAV